MALKPPGDAPIVSARLPPAGLVTLTLGPVCSCLPVEIAFRSYDHVRRRPGKSVQKTWARS
jgi:hypothetical protein